LGVDSVFEECDVSCAQDLVNSLQVLQVVAPAMHSSLHSQVRGHSVFIVSVHIWNISNLYHDESFTALGKMVSTYANAKVDCGN